MFTENTRLELGRQVYLDSLEILSDKVASCTMNGLFDENYSGSQQFRRGSQVDSGWLFQTRFCPERNSCYNFANVC